MAPGELTIVRATSDLPQASTSGGGGSETHRAPALPVELGGFSVSVNGAAAGLYFVGNSQINFVVPIGLSAASSADVVINNGNNGTVIRGRITITSAQPDIFTTTMDAGGRALACNVTNQNAFPCLTEPFTVMSLDSSGTLVTTNLELQLTGLRNATGASSVTVTIGTADPIIATAFGPNPEMPGFDTIRFPLPANLAGAGDVPIVVTAIVGGVSSSSRPSATAPHITISP